MGFQKEQYLNLTTFLMDKSSEFSEKQNLILISALSTIPA